MPHGIPPNVNKYQLFYLQRVYNLLVFIDITATIIIRGLQ